MSTKRFACARMADYPTVVPESLQESTILVDLFRPGFCRGGALETCGLSFWSNISAFLSSFLLGTYGHTRTHHSCKHFPRFLNLSLSVAIPKALAIEGWEFLQLLCWGDRRAFAHERQKALVAGYPQLADIAGGSSWIVLTFTAAFISPMAMHGPLTQCHSHHHQASTT